MTRSSNLGKLVCERKQKASHLDQRWNVCPTENVTSDQQNQVLGLIDVTWTWGSSHAKKQKTYLWCFFLFSVQLHGVMRVVMEPLLGDIPLIGALSVFFLKKPVSTLTFGISEMLSGLVVSIMFPGWIFTLTSPKMLCFRCALICIANKGNIKLFTWKQTHTFFKLWANNLQNSSIPAPAVITEILLVFFAWWWSCWYCTLCHLPQRFSLQSSWRQPNSSPPLSVHSFSLTAAFLPVLQHGPSSRFSLWWWHSEEKYLLS